MSTARRGRTSPAAAGRRAVPARRPRHHRGCFQRDSRDAAPPGHDGGQAPGRGVAVDECARQDFPGRVQLLVGATYAGEPAGVVVAGGRVDILHAGVVVATRAQRLRQDQAGRARAPRTRMGRRARDATAGLTVYPPGRRLRERQLRRHHLRRWLRLGPRARRRHHRGRVRPAVPRRQDHPGPPHPPRPLPRARRVRQPKRTAPPQELRHRQRRLTITSPKYRNSFVAQVPELDRDLVARHEVGVVGKE
jgi:hypothetical protein